MTEKIKYTVGDILELKIEKIVPRGFGLAFADGLTVFVPLAVAGDRVRARIGHIKKRTAFADIVEILDASPAYFVFSVTILRLSRNSLPLIYDAS